MSLSPSQGLLAQATLIKQGAEAVSFPSPSSGFSADLPTLNQKVYSLDSLFAPPSIYWPPSGPSKSSRHPFPSQVSSLDPTQRSTGIPTTPVILKYRFSKKYRHPSLDAALTKSRLAFEARTLARCARAGMIVPRVLWVDDKAGVIGMERIEGWSVREVLGGGAEGETAEDDDYEEEEELGASVTSDPPSGEEEESEGWMALRSKGVSKGWSSTLKGACALTYMPQNTS